MTQPPLQHSEPLLQEAPTDLQHNPTVQGALQQAAPGLHGDLLPRHPERQMPKLQIPLEQSLFARQTDPFPHFPQSRLHSRPELALPHFSAPSEQLPSPPTIGQTPAGQVPLQQAALVEHMPPGPWHELMQKPKLQIPLAQVAFERQGVLVPHFPQSPSQTGSLFPLPQSSKGPSQFPSGHTARQSPAQAPVQQAASIVHGTPAG